MVEGEPRGSEDRVEDLFREFQTASNEEDIQAQKEIVQNLQDEDEHTKGRFAFFWEVWRGLHS